MIKLNNLPRLLGIGLIRLYQILISPYTRGHCRFEPSCSCYGIVAIKTHGLIKGSWLTGKRIIRCNPFGGSGYDPS